MNTSERYCIVPKLAGVGGMVSFQGRLTKGLQARGIDVTYELGDYPYQAVLVIGGTRQVAGLLTAKRRGIPIVQRLDGRNWLHRVGGKSNKGPGNIRHWLRAEYGNYLPGFIRRRIANKIAYQSRFSKEWWERAAGVIGKHSAVIYNGVNLEEFHPTGVQHKRSLPWRVLLVEGSLLGGYEVGLKNAIHLVERLRELFGFDAELQVLGRVDQTLKNRIREETSVPILWEGLVSKSDVPAYDRSADVLFSGDLNAACPNSVIEAMACGLPVIAFDTGALGELVGEKGGKVTPYGGDVWKLDQPDVETLARAAVEILKEPEKYKKGARQRAEELFGVEHMVERYLMELRRAGQ